MRAAIFDLDGTLLDSMGVWDEVDAEFLGRRGVDVPDDYADAVAAMRFDQVVEYTIARFGLDDTPEGMMAELDGMARVAYATTVRPKPGAVEYLRALRAHGVRLAVATSLPPSLRDPAMEHAGIRSLFDAVASVDDVGDVGKEEPDVYLLAARLLGVEPSDCVVFEDLLTAVRSARRAGMGVWGVYDDSSAGDWATIRREADGTVRDWRLLGSEPFSIGTV